MAFGYLPLFAHEIDHKSVTCGLVTTDGIKDDQKNAIV